MPFKTIFHALSIAKNLQKYMSVLLFGGAFNPPHKEHLHILKAAIAAIHPDKVLVMPTFISPHKSGNLMASPESRLQMCRLAFGEIPNVTVSSYEIEKGGVSYSYQTCEHIKEQIGEEPLYFLMGADMLASFDSWRFPERILKVATLVACARESEADFVGFCQKVQKKFGQSPVVVPYVGAKVSSTDVRTLAACGEDVTEFVGPFVAQYMRTNALYAVEIAQKVKLFLKPERWQHTVRVCVAAVRNCKQAGVDELTAFTAAVCHDVAKYVPLSSPQLKGFVPPENVPDPVMHQFTGAYIAEHTLGITDPDILNAVRHHTTGRAAMSPLEKLIFLADLVEDGRGFNGVEELRKMYYIDLDACYFMAIKHQVEFLNTTGMPVYDLTQKSYDYYKNLQENKND